MKRCRLLRDLNCTPVGTTPSFRGDQAALSPAAPRVRSGTCPRRGTMPTGQPGCRHLAVEAEDSNYLPSGPGGGSGRVAFRTLHGGGGGIARTGAALSKARNWKQKITGNSIGKQIFTEQKECMKENNDSWEPWKRVDFSIISNENIDR